MNEYLVVFGAGTSCGIGLSFWFCNQRERFRSPRYYRRRAGAVSRGGRR